MTRITTRLANLRIVGALCVGALSLGLVACSSSPDKKSDASKAEKRIAQPYQVQKPSPEELAKSPCGNPDWAQLPEGAAGKSDTPDADAPAKDPTSETPRPSAEQSSNTSRFSKSAPCT